MTGKNRFRGLGARRRRRARVAALDQLAGEVEVALAAVDEARAELSRVVADGSPTLDRRAAHAALRHAFEEADALLRQATGIAKEGSYSEWSLWRRRLSTLDRVRQIHLFAERDDSAVLPIGSVRAIDTGMSGPDIGDLQHGRSRPPGAPAMYGLDVDALLAPRPAPEPSAAIEDLPPVVEPLHTITPPPQAKRAERMPALAGVS